MNDKSLVPHDCMHLTGYDKTIRTVSEINHEIQKLVEGAFYFVRVAGEISTLRRPHSGHYYFILKDQHAQIRAVLFKNKQRFLPQGLKDGQQVVCDGRISVYEPRGEYQIIIDTIDFHGAGQLQIAFENLKGKLKSRGYFDTNVKRPLPDSVRDIVLITSPGGAAVHDFLSICRKRRVSLNVRIIPVPVQGTGAARRICDALATAHQLEPDVIVLCRGGGSMEDLWAFNDEELARAIFEATIPVVTGIGHETDFTIADFCADIRGATPTAAAELIVPDGTIYRDRVRAITGRLSRSFHYRLASVTDRLAHINRTLATFDSAFSHPSLRLDALSSRLCSVMNRRIERQHHWISALEYRLHACAPDHQLVMQQAKLDHLCEKLQQSVWYRLEVGENGLQRAAALLDSLSPLATLARGYSIVTKAGRSEPIITDIEQVAVDEEIDVQLHRGSLGCIVSSKHR